jgi:hypothetical protein
MSNPLCVCLAICNCVFLFILVQTCVVLCA